MELLWGWLRVRIAFEVYTGVCLWIRKLDSEDCAFVELTVEYFQECRAVLAKKYAARRQPGRRRRRR